MKIKISSSLQLTTHFKSLRKAKGWSQKDLGRRIGVTQSRVAQIESNPALISVDQLIQILHVLDANLMIELEKSTDNVSLNLKSPVKRGLAGYSKEKTPPGKPSWMLNTVSDNQALPKDSSQPANVYSDSSTGRFTLKSHTVKNSKTKW